MSYQYDVLRYMAKAKRMAILVKLLMNCKNFHASYYIALKKISFNHDGKSSKGIIVYYILETAVDLRF